jgi:hypothetical protein
VTYRQLAIRTGNYLGYARVRSVAVTSGQSRRATSIRAAHFLNHHAPSQRYAHPIECSGPNPDFSSSTSRVGGTLLSFSQRPRVPGSTPRRRASFSRVGLSVWRHMTTFPSAPSIIRHCKGSYPRNSMMLGTSLGDVGLRLVSQHITVPLATPSIWPTSLCKSLRSSRLFLRWSPRVFSLRG